MDIGFLVLQTSRWLLSMLRIINLFLSAVQRRWIDQKLKQKKHRKFSRGLASNPGEDSFASVPLDFGIFGLGISKNLSRELKMNYFDISKSWQGPTCMDFYDQCLFRNLGKLKEHFIKFGLPSFFIHLSALLKSVKKKQNKPKCRRLPKTGHSPDKSRFVNLFLFYGPFFIWEPLYWRNIFHESVEFLRHLQNTFLGIKWRIIFR